VASWILQVLGSGGVDRVRNIADQYITDRLNDVDGVGGVEVFGGRQKTVEIIMHSAICEANGITPNTISNVLSRNSNKSAFAGQVEMEGQKVFVNVTAELKDIKNIQSLVVSEKGPTPAERCGRCILRCEGANLVEPRQW
jgi:multidrug efflux pump subunit AcrB